MRAHWRVRDRELAVTGQAGRWIRRITIVGSVGMLAPVAGTVSYPHMHLLVERLPYGYGLGPF
jgi:hypothetical protein